MNQPIDLIIKGNIITMAEGQPRLEAIGVIGGKIAAGSASEIEQNCGKSTRIIDLKDKTVLPGFIDSHTHPMRTGRHKLGVNLSLARSTAEVLNLIRQRTRTLKTGRWIWCYGHNPNNNNQVDSKILTQRDLDDVSTQQPIYVQDSDGHSALLNSLAFSLLEKADRLPEIFRDTDGQPTGIFEDPAAGHEVIGDAAGDDEQLEVIDVFTNQALKAGICTAFIKEPLENVSLFSRHSASIPLRIKPMYTDVLSGDNLDQVIRSNPPGLTACAAIVSDGSLESRSAALNEPYFGQPANRGKLNYGNEQLRQFIEKAHTSGLQISIHAESDRSIEQVLCEYERVLEKYPKPDHRHRIEHFEIPTLNQIKRAAKSGLALGMQPMFIPVLAGPDMEHYRRLVGNERLKRLHPYRTILEHNILVSGGSDTPVTEMSPLKAIQACLTHPNWEQRISVHEALQFLTINGARIGFLEKTEGTLEAGKSADLVVLSADPYRVPPGQIGDIEVEMTMIGGEVVYQK